MPATELNDCRFLKACRREPVDATPVWIMRQAGRYLPEYMAVRSKVTFMDLCTQPELAAEVTLTAQRVLGVDAAILFADLLPMLQPMGFDLEYAKGEGPVIHNPLKQAADIDRVRELEDVSSLHFTFDAVKLIRRELPGDIPLLGFAGAPFTLASYCIEGGGSKHYIRTKTLMYADEGAWQTLMERLARSLIRYIRAQVDAGCQAVQLFDSWAGCLSPTDYARYVLPYTKMVIDGIPAGVPVINFLTGNPALLPLIKQAGGSVFGLDWRVDLMTAWNDLGETYAVQGNLDPLVLQDWSTAKRQAEDLLTAVGRRPGHIFNLGHGVLPETPPDNVKALVQLVHERSAALRNTAN
ncbi:uroporphyrinogen decarboxylase [Planctellipticum variicoloris]|uniref:uroporphyrinogen decarboxylase n=1 Tax=Planctellipticum variicoloris TaxID=3064265 RepID=UPI003013D731|nr:uroporphyrinogen decarboxylase [Planctomycetaceae bacterium SH412]